MKIRKIFLDVVLKELNESHNIRVLIDDENKTKLKYSANLMLDSTIVKFKKECIVRQKCYVSFTDNEFIFEIPRPNCQYIKTQISFNASSLNKVLISHAEAVADEIALIIKAQRSVWVY